MTRGSYRRRIAGLINRARPAIEADLATLNAQARVGHSSQVSASARRLGRHLAALHARIASDPTASRRDRRARDRTLVALDQHAAALHWLERAGHAASSGAAYSLYGDALRTARRARAAQGRSEKLLHAKWGF